jgi:hypothetical protein
MPLRSLSLPHQEFDSHESSCTMPPVASRSLSIWETTSARALDQIESAHAALGGTGPGRRYATQQINHAYAVLLTSQFQRFCRDLHTEAAAHLSRAIVVPALRDIVRKQLTAHRKLDVGNPNPGNLGSDFARFDMDLRPSVLAVHPSNDARRDSLDSLCRWRNAIAHHDFGLTLPGGRSVLRLADVRRWRRACDVLARDFDMATGHRVATITGVQSW